MHVNNIFMTQVCLEICNLMADSSTLLCRYLFWTTCLVSHEIFMAMQISSSVSQAFLCSWPLTSFNHLLGVWSVTILIYLVNRGKVITWSLPAAKIFLKRKWITSETLPPCIKISPTCLLHLASLPYLLNFSFGGLNADLQCSVLYSWL